MPSEPAVLLEVRRRAQTTFFLNRCPTARVSGLLISETGAIRELYTALAQAGAAFVQDVSKQGSPMLDLLVDFPSLEICQQGCTSLEQKASPSTTPHVEFHSSPMMWPDEIRLDLFPKHPRRNWLRYDLDIHHPLFKPDPILREDKASFKAWRWHVDALRHPGGAELGLSYEDFDEKVPSSLASRLSLDGPGVASDVHQVPQQRISFLA